ncbi:MAG: hypothetical protein ABR915_09080 [Thermoguttaceae bacterium]|jgi:hypothetical protein
MFCRLVQLPTGRWHCPACDPEAGRTVPIAGARRHCRVPSGRPLAASQLAARALAIELTEAHANGRLGVSMVEIERRLAVCRRCGDFRGAGCRVFSRRYAACRAWFWALAADPARQIGPCEHWEKGDSPHLCEAPGGRAPTEGWSRQMGTVPFFPLDRKG